MTSEIEGIQELGDHYVDLVSGGADDKLSERIRQAGRDFANAIEDGWDWLVDRVT